MNIENKKQFATLALAIGLGLVAAYLTAQYVKSSIDEQRKIIVKNYEKKSSKIIQEFEGLRGQLKKLEQNQVSLAKQQKHLASQPRGAGNVGPGAPKEIVDSTVFSVVTPPGKRAMTVLLDSLSAVGGLINPGDFVDIIGHLKIPKPGESQDNTKVTSVLFQNVQVLAVGANFKPVGNAVLYQTQQQTKQLNVTLAVNPEEASLLSFAQSFGRLQLTLRSPSERSTKEMQVASWDALADYVLERQGTELDLPKSSIVVNEVSDDDSDEVEPFIQIFRAGREL